MAASVNATIFHFRETSVSCFSSLDAGGAVAIVDVGVSSWRSLGAGIVELGTVLVVLRPSLADTAKRTFASCEMIELRDAAEVEDNPETAVEGVVVTKVESEVSRAAQASDCVWDDW
jgi:hypothetical protein